MGIFGSMRVSMCLMFVCLLIGRMMLNCWLFFDDCCVVFLLFMWLILIIY